MNENEKAIKEAAVIILEAIVDQGIAPRTVATFTGINYRKIYRWLGGQFFRPSLEECKKLEYFLKLAGGIRKNWLDVVVSWNGRYHKSVRAVLYRAEAVRILSSKAEPGEQATKLTALTFRRWAEEKE